MLRIPPDIRCKRTESQQRTFCATRSDEAGTYKEFWIAAASCHCGRCGGDLCCCFSPIYHPLLPCTILRESSHARLDFNSLCRSSSCLKFWLEYSSYGEGTSLSSINFCSTQHLTIFGKTGRDKLPLIYAVMGGVFRVLADRPLFYLIGKELCAEKFHAPHRDHTADIIKKPSALS